MLSKEKLEQLRQVLEDEKKIPVKEGSWILQRHWWRGPIVIRFGPSTQHWDLRWMVDKKITHFVLDQNPIENDEVFGYTKPCKDLESMKVGLKGKEELKPGTPWNPTKDTPAYIEAIDHGNCVIYEDTSSFKKVEFKGKELKGLRIFVREGEGPYWTMQVAKGPKAKQEKEAKQEKTELKEKEVKREKEVSEKKEETKVSFLPFFKIEKMKHLVYGPVLKPGVADSWGVVPSAEEVEKAAHEFLATYSSVSDPFSISHKDIVSKEQVQLVESYLTLDEIKTTEETIPKGSWIVVSKVLDEELWKKILDGTLKGYSLEGVSILLM